MNSKSSSRKDAKPGTKDNLFQTPTSASGARGGQVSRTPTPNQFAFSKEQKHLNSVQTRRSCAPVKKIPNVHSVASLPSAVGTDPQVVWRQLVQERQRNKILQLEIERLRKSLDICKKTVKEKCSEIEHKNKLINKLIEDKTRIESTEDVMEDDIDIDNLLHANLGEVDLSDILNLTDSAFPDDLASLDMTNLVSEHNLSLSPASLAMATNTSYVVEEEEEESVQFPNREGSAEVQETVEMKGIVGRMVEQRRSFQSAQEAKVKQKVSPIKIIKGGNQYKLANKKRQNVLDAQTPEDVTPCKKLKASSLSEKAAPQCLSCTHCNKQFPLGGQWKLTRHITSAHSSIMSYSCQYCDKQFTCQSILTAHNEWHLLTNPWQCEECGYRLGSLTQFIKHVKKVHKVNSLTKIKRLLVSTKD